jgi:NAD(P)-dependent dehydrogenase (short-subunit alcohol dehydrogenase family)
MDYQIKGKYAFINAGAHGIGEATAVLLTQEGTQVIVADSATLDIGGTLRGLI